MKGRLAIAILGLILASCQRAERRPEEVLAPEVMEEVLFDIHLAEGALKSFYVLADSAKKTAPALYEEIYARHGLSSAQFTQSLDWYLGNPEQMEQIQKKVVERLLLEEK